MQTQLSFHSSKKNASPIWIIFLLHFVVLLVSSDNSLKVCTKDGQVHQVSAVSCNKGAWTSETVEVDCVCATGMYGHLGYFMANYYHNEGKITTEF
jgi:hypothetical protein